MDEFHLEEATLDLIKQNPIGDGLQHVRARFSAQCRKLNLPELVDALQQFSYKDHLRVARPLLSALGESADACELPASSGLGSLSFELSQVHTSTFQGMVNLAIYRDLWRAVLADEPNDISVWTEVYKALHHIARSPRDVTPPSLSSVPPHVKATPLSRNSGSIVNSSETRAQTDGIIQSDLACSRYSVPGFDERFFATVPGLEQASIGAFEACKCSSTPLYTHKWVGWPDNADEAEVLKWLSKTVGHLKQYAALPCDRLLRTEPNTPVPGSTAVRKVDFAIYQKTPAATSLPPGAWIRAAGSSTEPKIPSWVHLLVIGELKSSEEDSQQKAFHQLGSYVREMFGAHPTRRFVLGFTLWRSSMRIWEFDRVGAVGSDSFDIHMDPQRFVKVMIGFHHMNQTQLGFDPTFITDGDQTFIIVNEDEKVIIDYLMYRSKSIVGRATTCWLAHSVKNPGKQLVIKDSWQCPERPSEGEMLLKARMSNVKNVAQHYYHETVQVDNMEDDVLGNVRRGLDTTKGRFVWPRKKQGSYVPSTLSSEAVQQGSQGPSSSTHSGKHMEDDVLGNVRRGLDTTEGRFVWPREKQGSRVPSPLGSAGLQQGSQGPSSGTRSRKRAAQGDPDDVPSSKRLKSGEIDDRPTNRVHRRVIVEDYGHPLYKCKSLVSLLKAMVACIEGHQSLYNAGILHRDISLYNMMAREDESDPKGAGFLIDLDLAIDLNRTTAPGAKSRTGTPAFMALAALSGAQPTFMHDLEAFFWVLFWICIHYRNGVAKVDPKFDDWNYAAWERVEADKNLYVTTDHHWEKGVAKFTTTYTPLRRWMRELRKVIFPNNGRYTHEDKGLYGKIINVLQKALNDEAVKLARWN